ncbi:hypothetical protein V2J09_008918 [Rumex salicifolius]
MCMDEGEDVITYKDHFKRRHGIDLRFDNEVLLGARPMFRMHNFLLNYGQRKRKDRVVKSDYLLLYNTFLFTYHKISYLVEPGVFESDLPTK